MRPWEAVLVVLAAHVLWRDPEAPLARWAIVAMPVALLLHLALEKPRWQLAATYLQVVHLSYAHLYSGRLASRSDSDCKWPYLLAHTALLLLVCAMACLFPVSKFPALSGPFRTVGVSEHWVSLSSLAAVRSSDTTLIPLANEIEVQAFWPSGTSEPPAFSGAQFMTAEAVHALARNFLHMPAWLFSSLPLAKIRAVKDAPLVSVQHVRLVAQHATRLNGAEAAQAAAERLPVVVFSHGLGGSSAMYASQCTDLASHGFIVVALTHTDTSASYVARRLPSDPPVPYRHVEVFNATEEDINFRRVQIRLRVNEISRVLDALAAGEGSFAHIRDRADMDKVALVGHSFGASTVVSAGIQYPGRVKAVVAQDLWTGPFSTETIHGGAPQPLLLVHSHQWATEWPQEQITIFLRASKSASKVSVRGTRHSNFGDIPRFARVTARMMNNIGTVDFDAGIRTINALTTAFLNSIFCARPEVFQAVISSNRAAMDMHDTL
jgi:pimeloyl-ACP methyl ester carboxylesterase